MLYFSFTTLTTIGLGDITPCSNIERIFIALAMVAGVAIFSYFLAELGEMIFFYKKHFELNEDDEDDDTLLNFFAVIKKFNYDNPVEH